MTVEKLTDQAAHAQELVDDAMRFVFQEYDPDNDGYLARKDFFAFLWKLKSESGYQLNEGQMISCWAAMDPNGNGQVNFQEFLVGLEKIYDNYFYAIENNAPVPETHYKMPGMEDMSSYNTIRFKNSAAVALFGAILEEEKKQREVDEKLKQERIQALLAAKDATKTQRIRLERELREPIKSNIVVSPRDSPSPASSERTSTYSISDDKNATLVPRSRESISSEPPSLEVSVTSLSRENSNSPGLARSGFNAVSRDSQLREQKKKEADEELQRILSVRHKEERQRRESERLKKQEEERLKLQKEAESLLAEPSWKRRPSASLKN